MVSLEFTTAREYRISAERIHQLEAKALEQMKDVLDRPSRRGSRQLLRALLYLHGVVAA